MNRFVWLVALGSVAGCVSSEGDRSDRGVASARTRDVDPVPVDDPPASGDVAGLPEVVAEIDGDRITRDVFLKATVDWYGRAALEEMILRRILDKSVEHYGVTVSKQDTDRRIEQEIVARDAEAKRDHGVSLEQFLAADGKTVADFRKILRENEDFKRQILLEEMVAYAYLTEAKVHVKQIVVRDKSKAEDVLKKLKDGADFAALAQQESDDDFSAQKGGDLPTFIRGMSRYGDEFEKAAFGLVSPGDVSGIVTSERGYHILKLVKAEPANPQTFEALHEKIGAIHMDRNVLATWMARLRQDYARNVKYLAPSLDPKGAAKDPK